MNMRKFLQARLSRNDDPSRFHTLPQEYRILPAETAHMIPGFEEICRPEYKTLAIRQRDSVEWFHEFVDTLLDAIGNRYLPVMRFSDGEYLFLFGEQPPDVRLPLQDRMEQYVRHFVRKARQRGTFQARTMNQRDRKAELYHSGVYSELERNEAQDKYARSTALIAKRGILALHLMYGPPPFQERFHPALGRWLKEHSIALTDQNYFPFYFVYAALAGPRRHELLTDRRILVVNGAPKRIRLAIERGLKKEGARDVRWLGISSQRSLFDVIDVSEHRGKCDLCLVGAGIGKPNILVQLEPLGVPCVDAGYMFAVWQDEENGRQRVFCELK